MRVLRCLPPRARARRRALPVLASLAGLATACAAERPIEVDASELTLPRGAGTELTLRAGGEPLPDLAGFTLTSDDPAIASVGATADGRRVSVVGVAERDPDLGVALGDRELAIPTHVDAPAVVGFTIEPAGAAAPVGGALALRALVVDSLGARRDVTAATAWEVEDPRIARVDGGTLRGLAAGSTTLYARLDGRAAELELAVVAGR